MKTTKMKKTKIDETIRKIPSGLMESLVYKWARVCKYATMQMSRIN